MTDESSLAARASAGTSGTPHVGAELDRLRERLDEADGLLLCLDFDGTLAPIVSDPDEATLLPASREPLAALADHPAVELAVISGRALADVRDRADLPGAHYAGNHGLETLRDGERSVHPDAERGADAVAAAVAELRDALADVPGARVEDKEVTATVHFRETPPERTDAVREAVREAAADRPLRVTSGKQILELRPDVDCDKGDAVRRLVEAHEGYLPMYVGDDTTDEAAFETVAPDGVGVHVGDDETAADTRVADPEGVAALLEWLADEGVDHLDSGTD